MKHILPLAKAVLLALAVAIIFLIGLELHWRGQGYELSYNNNEALWAHQRAKVYQPAEKTTVFIGSSRIKFDLDIPTWERTTSEKAVQLALEGTSPRQILRDLADDENFRGKLVVDVTEGLFFAPDGARPDNTANESIAYYRKISPTQRFGFQVNRVLESAFVFLDSERFSVKSLLSDLPLPRRPEVFIYPAFPKKFVTVAFSGQTTMTDAFVADTSMRNKMIGIWMGFGGSASSRGVGGDTLRGIISSTKTAVEKIKARGGHVFFVRTPSSGGVLATEKTQYPRALYWDRLLRETGCEGIHFQDYPAMAHFECPEWSHLAAADGKVFTGELAGILKQKNWFSQTPTQR